MPTEDKRLQNLLRHIGHVRDDCLLLGGRLADRGEAEVGRRLVANGFAHDLSKFHGVEWEYLNDGRWPYPDDSPDKALFLAAHRQHVTTNRHHPEAWPGGVDDMDRLHLAEMVCDWHARATEFGTDLLEWVKDKAAQRYGFATSGRVYKEIKGLVDLLLEKPF